MKTLMDKVVTTGALLAILGSGITGLLFLDNRHASKVSEYEYSSVILDLDIKKDAELIAHYDRIKLVGLQGLSIPQTIRYNYIQKEMKRKMDKKDLVDQQIRLMK
jgi:hypothetical protein